MGFVAGMAVALQSQGVLQRLGTLYGTWNKVLITVPQEGNVDALMHLYFATAPKKSKKKSRKIL